MPSWNDVLNRTIRDSRNPGPLDKLRRSYIRQLSAYRDRNVICYYSGWLQHPQNSDVDINDLDVNGLMNAVNGMNREKGLDLILHTPGGFVAATEAVISYLRSCFGKNIDAFVPQLAMSGGTLIACSCNKIFMGKQSSLGPTDPQFGAVAASGIVDEFERAKLEAHRDPSSLPLWQQLIAKYPPAFVGECQRALDISKSILQNSLERNMFSDDDSSLDSVVNRLSSHEDSGMHDRHYSAETAKEIGLHVEDLENDDKLQDLVLTIHHSFMITFQQSSASKIIENNLGKAWILSGTPQNGNNAG